MQQLETYRRLVEEALPGALPQGPGAGRLTEACRYSLLAGGKRLRGVLLLAAADYAGCPLPEALPAALAVEMIHTYSLIHDDLPAMDNDVLRRGKPTNHVVYGEALAILAGDGLLTHAFQHLLLRAAAYPSHAQRHLRAAGRLAQAAGLNGMAAGQALDIACERQGSSAPEADLAFIHQRKTAALFEGAALAGLELGGAPQLALERFARYARTLGLAFQLADDLLDECATTEQMGKTVGKDKRSGKLTYPSVYGQEKARQRLCALTQEAQDALHGQTGAEFFLSLAQALAARQS